MDLKTIEIEVERIRKNCDLVDNVLLGDRKQLEEEIKQIDSYKTTQLNEYNQKLETLLNGYKGIYENVRQFGTIFSDDYKEDFSSFKRINYKEDFSTKSLDENRDTLKKLNNEFGQYVKELEMLNFDELDKPHNFAKKGKKIVDLNDESFEPIDAEGDDIDYSKKKVLLPYIINYLTFDNKIGDLVEIICHQINLVLSSNVYKNNVETISKNYIAIRNREIEDKNASLFDKYFVDENKEATKKEFFDEIDTWKKETNVSIAEGANVFMEKIAIGELKVDVSSKHASYFQRGENYKKNIRDGHLYPPLVWDFTDKGNIVINTYCESYSDNIINFVRQLILEFVSSFPARRTRIKLIDLDNKMDFSVLSRLANADRDIMDGGIVRTETELTPTIQDFNNHIFKIKDDMLSYNMVKNIFEFNQKFKANPQSVYLFVFANFPYCLRDDSIKKVYDIVNNGNDSGVFSIIINNESYSKQQGLNPENYEKTLKMIEDKSLVIEEKDKSLIFKGNNEYLFVPRDDFKIDDLQMIIDRLKSDAKKSTQIIISTDEMFEYIDNENDDDSPAIKLNIPIGKRGGDVQLLSFDASSTNTHALAIGSTGSGKSVLLHTIILNACYKYSPEDLNLYIIDFKGGVEFKYYESKEDKSLVLPHIRLTGLTSDVEDGLAILKNIESILTEREGIFTGADCQNIYEYCKKVEKLPRILVIIDEIQTLFDENENIAFKAIKIIDKILTKGRAFGICILWASQGVPRTPGSNKLLSETGNKICLKLQNPQDAAAVNVDPKMVAQLGQIEKGLGVFNDTPSMSNSKSFRVAYSESAEKRIKYSRMIINKWNSVINSKEIEPLFVVGNDAQPNLNKRGLLFNYKPSANDIKSYASGKYDIVLGENYVTGKPYITQFGVRVNMENMLLLGTNSNISVTRNIMGFALLSVLCNHFVNKDVINDNTKIYYSNGEKIDETNRQSLMNIIRNDFDDKLSIIDTKNIVDKFKEIYKLYKKRYSDSSESEEAIDFAPIFIFIHWINESFYEIFDENPVLQFKEKKDEKVQLDRGQSYEDKFAALNSAFDNKLANNKNIEKRDSGTLNNINFVDAISELMDRGGKYGIHFVISGDKPTELKRMKEPLRKFKYKLITKGVKAEYISELISDYRNADSFNKLNVCWINYEDNKDKIKYYQFDYDVDKYWYQNVKDNYNNIK